MNQSQIRSDYIFRASISILIDEEGLNFSQDHGNGVKISKLKPPNKVCTSGADGDNQSVNPSEIRIARLISSSFGTKE